MPCRGARQSQPHGTRDERAAAADGADGALGELQPRPSHVAPARDGRPRPVVHAGTVKAVFLLGPTASGKSAVALALATRLPAEIVSVDSAQVYRGMDVGTAKPSPAERA